MQSADKKSGQSPHVWLRAIGWYVMALVDTIELLQEGNKQISSMIEDLKMTIEAMIKFQDDEGMWFQVVEEPHYEGNYLESSGTMMMTYGILKVVRLGYILESYKAAGLKAFEGTIGRYLIEQEGKFHFGGTCEVAGLDNESRDGSIEYYLSEPVVSDEAKGVAPFIMAYS